MNEQSEPVADALVTTTASAGEQLFTDATGSALFANVESGFHLVTASHPIFGVASEPVSVEAGQLISVELRLDADIPPPPDAPSITILQPTTPASYVPGETITFAARIVDDATPPPELQVVWRSDVDGVIHDQPPDAQGMSQFSTSTLSAGVHTISVTATDQDANTALMTLVVANDLPPRVVLEPLTKDMNAIYLTWSRSTETRPFQYVIYRATAEAGPFEVIQNIADTSATQYRDDAIMLSTTYSYRVGVDLIEGPEAWSNVESVEAGIFLETGTQVEEMLVDPLRNYLYALDRVNNTLHFVNLDTLTLERSIFVGSTPTDMDFDLTGNRLFIANFGSTEIAVVDLELQQKTGSLFVVTDIGWDGNPYRLVATANNTLVFTSEDQWNDLKLVDASTGAHIVLAGSIYRPGLTANADGTRVYVAESGSTGSQLQRFDVGPNTLTYVESSATAGGFGSRVAVLTGDESAIFYAGKKYLANNLSAELGTFAEVIHAANFDGSLAIGSESIWDGLTFSIARPLPLATSVMALSTDEQTLYLYDVNTGRIYLHDLSDL